MNRLVRQILILAGILACVAFSAGGAWVAYRFTKGLLSPKAASAVESITNLVNGLRDEPLYINKEREGTFATTTIRGQTYVSLPDVMKDIGYVGLVYQWKGSNLDVFSGWETMHDVLKENQRHPGNTQLLINDTVVDNVNIVEKSSVNYISLASLYHLLQLLHFSGRLKKNGLYVQIPEFTMQDRFHTGVARGIQNTGTKLELWKRDINGDLTLKDLHYDPASNKIPIEGTYGGNRSSVTVMVSQWIPKQPKSEASWYFTIPVHHHYFSSTILLPFSGAVDVQVQPSLDTLNVKKGQQEIHHLPMEDFMVHSTHFLSLLQISQLQSPYVDYDAPSVQKLARQIADSVLSQDSHSSTAQLHYDEIHAVSNWVSEHVAYDWKDDQATGKRVPQPGSWTLTHKTGINEDETTVTVTLLRALGIPSDVVLGYAGRTGQPNQSHEWVQAWDGRRWIQLDPTWNQVYTKHTTGLPQSVTNEYFGMSSSFFFQHYKPVRLMQF